MLAFFVPTFVSLHLPSSINTSLKGSLLLASNGGHTPPVENQFCMLRGSDFCARLGFSRPSRSCSLWPIKRTSSPKLVFLCLLSSYAVSLCGLRRSCFKISQCILHLLNVEILVARWGGISYGGGVQVPYEETRPTRRFFCA